MKSRTYKFGTFTFKAYFKKVGNSFEVAVKYGPKVLFLGNFIHRVEANKWWTYMNKEITTFKKLPTSKAKAAIRSRKRFGLSLRRVIISIKSQSPI